MSLRSESLFLKQTCQMYLCFLTNSRGRPIVTWRRAWSRSSSAGPSDACLVGADVEGLVLLSVSAHTLSLSHEHTFFPTRMHATWRRPTSCTVSFESATDLERASTRPSLALIDRARFALVYIRGVCVCVCVCVCLCVTDSLPLSPSHIQNINTPHCCISSRSLLLSCSLAILLSCWIARSRARALSAHPPTVPIHFLSHHPPLRTPGRPFIFIHAPRTNGLGSASSP